MALLLIAWNEQWKRNRAAKSARQEEEEALKASRRAPSLVRPPEPIFNELVSTNNEADNSSNVSWDAVLIQTLVQNSKGGWRVPLPEEQPGNADVWRILRHAHAAPNENIFERMLKKIGLSSNDDADVRVSDDEAPYKSKNPYLPRNVYEQPPRAHIRTPSGLFVSTARVWEIQFGRMFMDGSMGFRGWRCMLGSWRGGSELRGRLPDGWGENHDGALVFGSWFRREGSMKQNLGISEGLMFKRMSLGYKGSIASRGCSTHNVSASNNMTWFLKLFIPFLLLSHS